MDPNSLDKNIEDLKQVGEDLSNRPSSRLLDQDT